MSTMLKQIRPIFVAVCVFLAGFVNALLPSLPHCDQSYSDTVINFIQQNLNDASIYYLGDASSIAVCKNKCNSLNYLCGASASNPNNFIYNDQNASTLTFNNPSCELDIDEPLGGTYGSDILLTPDFVASSNEYIIDADFTVLSDSGEAGILFKSSLSGEPSYWAGISPGDYLIVGSTDLNGNDTVYAYPNATIQRNTRYNLQVHRLSDDLWTVSLDGELKWTSTAAERLLSPMDHAGVWCWNAHCRAHSLTVTFPSSVNEALCAGYTHNKDTFACHGYFPVPDSDYSALYSSLSSNALYDCGIIEYTACPTPSPTTMQPSELTSAEPTTSTPITSIPTSQRPTPSAVAPTAIATTLMPTSSVPTTSSEPTARAEPSQQFSAAPTQLSILTTSDTTLPTETPQGLSTVPSETDEEGVDESEKDNDVQSSQFAVVIIIAGSVVCCMIAILLLCVYCALRKNKSGRDTSSAVSQKGMKTGDVIRVCSASSNNSAWMTDSYNGTEMKTPPKTRETAYGQKHSQVSGDICGAQRTGNNRQPTPANDIAIELENGTDVAMDFESRHRFEGEGMEMAGRASNQIQGHTVTQGAAVASNSLNANLCGDEFIIQADDEPYVTRRE